MNYFKFAFILVLTFCAVHNSIYGSTEKKLRILFVDQNHHPAKFVLIRIDGDDKKTSDLGYITYITTHEKVSLFVDTEIYSLPHTEIEIIKEEVDTLIILQEKQIQSEDNGVFAARRSYNCYKELKAGSKPKKELDPIKVRRIKPKPTFPFLKEIPKYYNNYIISGDKQRLSMFLYELNLPENSDKLSYSERMEKYKRNKSLAHYKYDAFLSTNLLRLILLSDEYDTNKDSIHELVSYIDSLLQYDIPKNESSYWEKYHFNLRELCNEAIRDAFRLPRCKLLNKKAKLFELQNQQTNLLNMLILILNDSCIERDSLYSRLDSSYDRIEKSIRLCQVGDSLVSIRKFNLAKEKYKEALIYNSGNISAINKQNLLLIGGTPTSTKKFRDISVNLIEMDLQQTINSLASTHKFPNISSQVIDNYESDKTLDIIIQYGMDDEDRVQNSLFYNYPLGEYTYNGSTEAVKFIVSSIDMLKYRFKNLYQNEFDISIIGSSDAVPYSGKFRYNSEYGNLKDDTVVDIYGNHYNFKSLLIGRSENKNLALAYLRAIQLKYELKKRNDLKIDKMNIKVYQSDYQGGEYRSVRVELKFKWKDDKD